MVLRPLRTCNGGKVCWLWYAGNSCVYWVLSDATISVLLDTLERVKKSLIFSRKRACGLIIFPLFCYIYICKVERFSINLALCRSSCYWHFGERNGVVRRRKNRYKKSVKKNDFFWKKCLWKRFLLIKKYFFVIFNIEVNKLEIRKISPISSMFDYFF